MTAYETKTEELHTTCTKLSHERIEAEARLSMAFRHHDNLADDSDTEQEDVDAAAHALEQSRRDLAAAENEYEASIKTIQAHFATA